MLEIFSTFRPGKFQNWLIILKTGYRGFRPDSKIYRQDLVIVLLTLEIVVYGLSLV
jgi:hypothetical protein